MYRALNSPPWRGGKRSLTGWFLCRGGFHIRPVLTEQRTRADMESAPTSAQKTETQNASRFLLSAVFLLGLHDLLLLGLFHLIPAVCVHVIKDVRLDFVLVV